MSYIRNWLAENGLGKYVAAFAENEIELDDLADLTEEDLEKLGLPMGPRKRFFRALAAREPSSPAALETVQRPHLGEGGAERRQLTVMFCDLVGSTALSESMDPEDFRDVITRYQGASAGAIRTYGGYIARYMGDGLLVYFGYPEAHEDDAERAVRAALAITSAVRELETTAASTREVRIGIATGLVVVGDIVGEGASEERAALGDTPNLAARLQGVAAPGTIVISAGTKRLIDGLFELADLGPQTLKGISAPTEAFQVIRASDTPSRFEAAASRGLTPLVGREKEIGLLCNRWRQALSGEAQLVLLCGESGVGKSRIVRAFQDRVGDRIESRVLQVCSPYHQRSAFRPVIEQLERDIGFEGRDPRKEKLDKLDAMLKRLVLSIRDHGPPLASLLSIEDGSHAPPSEWGPPELRRHTFESLIAIYEAMARQGPMLVVFEDAHWVDPSTEEFLGQLIGRVQSLPVLLVVTHRPEYVARWGSHSTVLNLSRLGKNECGELISGLTGGKALPQGVVDQIVARTDGVPLFTEELTKTVLDSGVLQDHGDHFGIAGEVSTLGIPSSLQDSLTARLDRLGSSKGAAQLASVLGRRFDYELLAMLSPLSRPDLVFALNELVRAGLIDRVVTEVEGTYEFKHALIQEAAYQSLLRTTRREVHERLASNIEHRYPHIAATEPELLAHHYTEANVAEKAVDYWQRAGQLAVERSANREAEGHVRRGLQILEALPRTPEWQRRYAMLQNTLGVSMMPTRGFGSKEVGDAFTAAAEACEAVDDRRGLYVALRGLGQYLFISGNIRGAASHVDRVMALAGEANDGGALLEAHHLAWITLTYAGRYAAARDHAEVGIATYDPERDHALTHTYTGHDPGVCCRSFCALPMWQLGYSDQASQLCRDGEDLARRLGHPFSIAVALWAKGIHQHLCGEVRGTWESAQSLIEFCKSGGFGGSIYRIGYILRGWSEAMDGRLSVGIAEMHRGMEQLISTERTEFALPSFYAQVAHFHGQAGAVHDGLIAIEQGISMAEKNGDYFSWPELQRVKGELLLVESAKNRAEAAACFQSAIEAARRQDARMLELRAAVGLAEIWDRQGKRQDALELLSPLYARFSEGFDTADLRGAKVLLDHLR